jgi:hypothetical protein
MKWVTRSHVHVDRVACPWLISRFVDSQAEFIYVPKNRVMAVVQEQGAIPYDVPDVELGHHGDGCSFDAIISTYELRDPALLFLAKIVNAADTNRLEAHRLAPGLEAIATGYSIRFPDDHENLHHQFAVYDALYAWCRVQVAKR